TFSSTRPPFCFTASDVERLDVFATFSLFPDAASSSIESDMGMKTESSAINRRRFLRLLDCCLGGLFGTGNTAPPALFSFFSP
ncbi:twin-arginine translocation signal domain-containing protein, partial [Nitriliruptoraceae bacterium ZYF776]|nr:twin-arginine translocation signal domain-containing protein [Profundirhabdus halotolerans]